MVERDNIHVYLTHTHRANVMVYDTQDCPSNGRNKNLDFLLTGWLSSWNVVTPIIIVIWKLNLGNRWGVTFTMMWFDWMILRSSLIAHMSRYSIIGDQINELEKEIEVCSFTSLKSICYCSPTLSMVPKLRSWTKGLKQGLWKVQPTIALLVTEVSRGTISSAVSHARSVCHFSQLHSQPLRLQFSPTFHATWLITTQSFAKWDILRANLLHGFALSYPSLTTKGHKPSY